MGEIVKCMICGRTENYDFRCGCRNREPYKFLWKTLKVLKRLRDYGRSQSKSKSIKPIIRAAEKVLEQVWRR